MGVEPPPVGGERDFFLDLLAAEARRFHLDRPTGIDLPNETRRMIIPDDGLTLHHHGYTVNLAHAVLLIGYEWFVSGEHAVGRPPLKRRHRRGAKASNEEVLGFFEHLERELEAAGFLYPPEKAPRMVRNLRNMFHRTGLTEQDVRTLRGVVKALVEGGPGRYRKKPPA